MLTWKILYLEPDRPSTLWINGDYIQFTPRTDKDNTLLTKKILYYLKLFKWSKKSMVLLVNGYFLDRVKKFLKNIQYT